MRKFRLILIITMVSVVLAACGTGINEQALPAAEEKASETLTEPDTGSETDVSDDSEAGKEVSAPDISKEDVKSEYPDEAYAEKINKTILTPSAFELAKTRGTDPESGDITDTSVYKIKGSIVKLVTDEYGSDGEIVTEYYYDNDNIALMKQHKTDIYGLNTSYEEADLTDIEADYTREMLKQGEKALTEAKENRGDVLLYGYVGDEQGGKCDCAASEYCRGCVA